MQSAQNMKPLLWKIWGNHPCLFLFIFDLLKPLLQKTLVGFRGIWAWIVGVEGERADHQTTTTGPGHHWECSCPFSFPMRITSSLKEASENDQTWADLSLVETRILSTGSVTRFGKISQLYKILKIFGNF